MTRLTPAQWGIIHELIRREAWLFADDESHPALMPGGTELGHATVSLSFSSDLLAAIVAIEKLKSASGRKARFDKMVREFSLRLLFRRDRLPRDE